MKIKFKNGSVIESIDSKEVKRGCRSKMSYIINDLFEMFEDCLTDEEMIASDLLAKISNRIIKERLDKQMSQVEFAKYLGVTQAMVSKWESEQYNFTIEGLVRICHKLDLKLDIDLKRNQERGKNEKRNKCEE